eukprot:g40687.t1
MNQEIHSLLNIRCATFKVDDPDQYRKSRHDFRKAIREAKRQHWAKLAAQTYQTDSSCLWQGLTNITGYTMKQSKIADNDTSLPDTVNAFNAQIEQNASSAVMPARQPQTHTLPLSPLQAKKGGEHDPIYINGTEVERVENVKFLGVTITNN